MGRPQRARKTVALAREKLRRRPPATIWRLLETTQEAIRPRLWRVPGSRARLAALGKTGRQPVVPVTQPQQVRVRQARRETRAVLEAPLRLAGIERVLLPREERPPRLPLEPMRRDQIFRVAIPSLHWKVARTLTQEAGLAPLRGVAGLPVQLEPAPLPGRPTMPRLLEAPPLPA